MAQTEQKNMSDFKRIERVSPLNGYILVIEWQDGTRTVKKMRELIEGRAVFQPLSDPTLFAQARVVDSGRVVQWNNEIDYCADALWAETQIVSEPISIPRKRGRELAAA